MAQTPQVWTDYLQDYEAGVSSTLLDFSYAGYHFSEEEIPDVSDWLRFDVTDYGALPDDEVYDDDGIQAAIDAAQASGNQAVVFFPTGKFIVSADNSTQKFIKINQSNIVLKGSGSGTGGTEIHMDEMRVANGHWQFQIEPEAIDNTQLTSITGVVDRGDFAVLVENAELLEVGQSIYISHQSEEFARSHFGDLELSEAWTRLFGSSGGMRVYEAHIIDKIEGKKVTFKNPVQIDLPLLSNGYDIRRLTTISEVGVEDILFTSAWEDYPEDFVHHKDDIHDYGWSAMQFNNVRDAWVRNCEFRSWNENIDVRQSVGVTIENVQITGKKGHASFLSRRGYGLLVKDCQDSTGQHHGPGTGYAGVNTVYVRCLMQMDQSVDAHSGQPYATLIDDVEGGVFDRNGGPHESYPHHARDFVFWNFRHNASDYESYNFWPVNRNGSTYAEPFFIGFQPNNQVDFQNEGLNELPGQMVEPRSLFDAQLSLRLKKQRAFPQVTFVTPDGGTNYNKNHTLTVAVEASDPDGTVAYVDLFIDDKLVARDDVAPYEWADFTELTNLGAGVYQMKAEVVDNDGNKSFSDISFTIGQAPTVEITRPEATKIVEVGDDLEVEVSLSDPDGAVAEATLFYDDTEIGTLTEAPFIWGGTNHQFEQLKDLKEGHHKLQVIAKDDDGLTAQDVEFFVVNVPPAVSFTVPSMNEEFPFQANIQINVSASDPDGTISEVKLYMNGEFLGNDRSVPYTWGFDEASDPELFNMNGGFYWLRAEATDNRGSKVSDSIKVSVALPLTVKSQLGENLYPNPFTEQVSINRTDIDLVHCFDMQGKRYKVSKMVEPNYTVLMPNVTKSGLYLIELIFSDQSIKRFRIYKSLKN